MLKLNLVLAAALAAVSVPVLAEETPVLPINNRIVYEGGREVGRGSVREYGQYAEERSGRVVLSGGSGSYNTRIEVGTVYPDSYFYDDDYHRHRRMSADDHFRMRNRMILEERRREAQRLSPNTNNKLYNEIVTKQRLEQNRQQHGDMPLREPYGRNRMRIEISR